MESAGVLKSAWRRGRWRGGRQPRPPRPLWRSLADVGVLAAAALLMLLAVHAFDHTAVTPGAVEVIDGDSFRRGTEEIRLYGIDAPEYRQTCRDENDRPWNCGREAARVLRTLVAGRTVACTGVDADRYGRLVSRCMVGDMVLNEQMVRLGWAIAYSRHASFYVQAEEDARRSRRGIWRGTFDLPEDWREIHRSAMTD